MASKSESPGKLFDEDTCCWQDRPAQSMVSKAPPSSRQSLPPEKGLAYILNPRAATRPRNEEGEGPTIPVLRHSAFYTVSKRHEHTLCHILRYGVCLSVSLSLPPPFPTSMVTPNPGSSTQEWRHMQTLKGMLFYPLKTQFCHRERNDFKSPITLARGLEAAMRKQSASWPSWAM